MTVVILQKTWPRLTVRFQLSRANKFVIYQINDSVDLFTRLISINESIVAADAQELPHVHINLDANTQTYHEVTANDCTLLSPNFRSELYDEARTKLQTYLVRNWPDFSLKSITVRKMGNHLVITIS